jgi:hypothetical protein
MSAIKRVA